MLLLLIGSTIWSLSVFSAAPVATNLGVFPENEELISDYDTHLGSRVTTSGPVVDTDPLTIRASTATGEKMDLRVTNADPQLSEGDILSVYGILRPNQEVKAINTVVKPADSYWRTRDLSALAGLWVLYRGLRHWRPNLRAALIERREDTDA